MNELQLKKKEFEESIKKVEFEMKVLKLDLDYYRKQLSLINEQIDADKPEAKTLGKEQASGNKV